MRYAVVAMSLLLCALSGEAATRPVVSQGTSSCAAPDSGGPCMLAFVSEQDGNSEIYVVNLDGTGLRRLTDHPGRDLSPAWSPDGARIAFVRHLAGDSDIYVMDADGSNVVRRTDPGNSDAPAWSADGKSIVFSSLRDGQFGLYVMSVDGDWRNPARVGFERGWNTHPAWSPDGKRIAFVSDWRAFDILYDVYVMNADGSEITPLFEGPFFWVDGLRFYFQPSWSPDGAKIAVVECGWGWDNCYPSSSIAVANADGSELKTLVQTGGYASPTWSPDSSMIAFSTQACPQCVGELRWVSADGTGSGVIFSNGHDPAWRPALTPPPPPPPPPLTCRPDAYSSCLFGRFRVEVRYRNRSDNGPVDTRAFSRTTSGGFADTHYETAFFYFNSPNNVEVVVKMLDEGARSGDVNTIPLLTGIATPFRIEVTVTDTSSHATTRTYTSGFGAQAGTTDWTTFVK
ncbi:MAG: hypothetical protein LC732_10640 [Acidobacteria bacterium]|nr:hypothetical protein [Acidobacteriota bacterium]